MLRHFICSYLSFLKRSPFTTCIYARFFIYLEKRRASRDSTVGRSKARTLKLLLTILPLSQVGFPQGD